ncbi:DUF1905 domain-containing protein [Streptomyces sp. NPDC051315]|uniref:DUF1905 domain-containing protein n=1 Tax=Streptomyces sp. NPDC051315 TaxID=3365650 RepID=UPI0037A126F2
MSPAGVRGISGTRGPVRIRGPVDGHPFSSSFMARGDGTHRLPVEAGVRQTIGGREGGTVTVRLTQRLSP